VRPVRETIGYPQPVTEIRQADLARERDDVRRLWLEYLTWGNDGLESRFGFRLPVLETVEHDLATVARFEPPEGRLLLAFQNGTAVGTGGMRRIGSDTAEIKRMYVEPRYRGTGLGQALLDHLLTAARADGYMRVRLDSPDFMTAAHGLYRSRGFTQIGPYPESEIPDEYKSHWVFMELTLI
jgi:GNAT superfamily N-acetyltransferase